MTELPAAPPAPDMALTGDVQPQLDLHRATPRYARSCFVTETPEEWILDFTTGVDLAPSVDPVTMRRVVVNPLCGKRLLSAIALMVHRHEVFFGRDTAPEFQTLGPSI